MPLFRKKPVVIEAVQWFKPGDHPAVRFAVCADSTEPYPVVPTHSGPQRVAPGDWIITGVEGEHYPCKPSVFEATYEAVDVSRVDTSVLLPDIGAAVRSHMDKG